MLNLTTESVLGHLSEIDLPFDEKGQLIALVRDFGFLGAVEYLSPKERPWSPQRDKGMASRHLDILNKLHRKICITHYQANQEGLQVPYTNKIIKTEVTPDHVEITLDNGTKLYVSSNPGYIHVHFSNIDIEQPIEVDNKAANQLDIKYKSNELGIRRKV